MYFTNHKVAKVNIDFINGYLTPLALLKDYLTVELGFDYFFKELNKETTIKEVIEHEISDSLDAYATHTKEEIFKKSDIQNILNKLDIVEVVDWKKNIKPELKHWLLGDISEIVPKEKQSTVWSSDFMINDFIELLISFFKTESPICWKLKGEILNDLYYHWGGIGYIDYFFETENKVFHLHFDYTD